MLRFLTTPVASRIDSVGIAMMAFSIAEWAERGFSVRVVMLLAMAVLVATVSVACEHFAEKASTPGESK